MFFTDEPAYDYDRYCDEQEIWLKSRPKCSECGAHIQDDHCYEISGGLVCPDCLENNHRKDFED